MILSQTSSRLLRQPDFLRLWFAQTISTLGSRTDALAFVAVLTLAATPAQMGLYAALLGLPSLLFGLLAGVWVDRLPRRPVMLACDLARCALLLLIPLALAAGRLSFGLLCAVAMLCALCGLIYELAYRAYLPTLIASDDLLEGNTRLATSDALAEMGGPAVGGVLVGLVGAPLTALLDALSFAVSAFSIAGIRAPETRPTRDVAAGGRLRALLMEMRAGFDVIAGVPTLRLLAVQTVAFHFFGSFYAALYSLYLLRDLGLPPAWLGVIIAAGGLGALPGALLAGRLGRRWPLGRVLTGALLVGGLTNALLPLAGGPAWLIVAMLLAHQLLGDAALTVYTVHETTLRQMIVPERMLGRANAAIGFISQAAGPLGALLCAGIAGALGARAGLMVAVAGGLVVAVWLARSPLRSLDGLVPAQAERRAGGDL